MKLVLVSLLLGTSLSAAPSFQVKFSPAARATPADGRLIVVISRQLQGEPRFQVGWGISTAQVFGIDVDGWKPGDLATVGPAAVGSPIRKLADLPPGKYSVQAVLNVYETVHRADGHTVKVHMDHGEGQQWAQSPGNLLSKPETVDIRADSTISITLGEAIPPLDPQKDTKYLRRHSIESKLLTKFWGRPMRIGVTVLVPEGFDANPQQKYPVAFLQGHFGREFLQFRETPPSPGGRGQAGAYQFYQDWTAGRLPKFLVVLTDHATPYYDDSYGVNTANAGPYGDALTTELYPEVEQKFRAIGQPWARVVFGGSTGGWMTLAQQIFYPDYFGGAWGFCPDPVDFHAFQMVNVYSDKNAYYDEGPFAKVPKLVGRTPGDRILDTFGDFNAQEYALGNHGRSGGQMDAFHATFGPVDAQGYPAKLWDAETGVIDPSVAKYWTEHYDLTAMLQRDWARLGPKLAGKLHITMGTKDTFFLDAAAHRMETFLESTKLPGKGPYYGGSFDFGNNEPHCYTGKIPEGVPTLSFHLRQFGNYLRTVAPEGADVTSWR